MTLQLVVSRHAQADIKKAIAWFGEISPTLPLRFGRELETVYASILEFPELYPVIFKNFRRALLHRFPYSVFYVVNPSKLLIVSVVHQAQNEETWKRRS